MMISPAQTRQNPELTSNKKKKKELSIRLQE